MFHTPVDAPLEWATVRDSGRLLLNVLKTFSDNTIPEEFWKKVYNIGGGKCCRSYGYGTYDEGFKIIGGSFKQFFKPWYNATRNFHGVWYTDSDILENYFHFRGQSCSDFWHEMKLRNRLYTMGRFVPRPIISALFFKRLLKDSNSPSQWIKKGDEARAIAYFGGSDKFYARKKLTWNDVELPVEIPDPVPMSSEQNVEAYGYDIDKADKDITASDLISVAEAHGGKCLNPVWDFDRMSKFDRIFARIWYDSHARDEDYVYYFDKDFKTHAEKTAEYAAKNNDGEAK